jgi:phosphoribosylglycinamide formyltransferase 1
MRSGPVSGNKLRLAVMLSGGGTNLQALIDRSKSGFLKADIVAVVSDRPDAYGLVRAQEAGIPTHVVDYKTFMHGEPGERLPVDIEELDRRQKILKGSDPHKRLERLKRLVRAEHEIIRILSQYEIDYVCLAGYMRLLSPYLLNHFKRGDEWRVINIHPALLPAFPGQHGYEDTFAYGGRWGGITVHFADEGEDSGAIIAQAAYPIWPEDDLDAVKKRGLQLEYELYAQCINWLAAGQLVLEFGEGMRTRVRITDPAYRDILFSWLQKAFA